LASLLAPSTRHTGQVESVVFDVQRRRVTVGPWSERARAITPPRDVGAPWTVVLELRRHVNLKIEADNGAERLRAELWSGQPAGSDGLAIVMKHDNPAGVARIPLCTCGERDCGNAGVQLDVSIPADELPRLVDLVRGLPDTSITPERGQTWDGDLPR
jgi:hypothetical protein